MKKLMDQNKKFISRDINTEAILGMEEISKNVEGITRGAQMTDLAERVAALTVRDQAQPVSPIRNSRALTATNNLTKMVLSVKIERTSHTISEPLPVVLFAPVNLIEQYGSILGITQTLPSGATCVVSVLGRKLVFKFTLGANADEIEVSTNGNVPYPVILEMLKNDAFQAAGFKYTAGTGNFDEQFNCFDLHYGRSTFKGLVDTDSVSFSTFKRTDQNQDNIINVDATIIANDRRYLVLGMAENIVNPGDAIIKLDFFIEDYDSTVDFLGETVCSR